MINHYYTHPPKLYKRLAKDSQVHSVYQMEKSIVGMCVNTHMSLEDLQTVSDHACRKFKVQLAEIVLVNSPGQPFGWADHKIYLNIAWHGDNLSVLLHELAHWIHDCKDLRGEDHGPLFMRIYIDLLDAYKLMPRACMVVLCETYGVEIYKGEWI